MVICAAEFPAIVNRHGFASSSCFCRKSKELGDFLCSIGQISWIVQLILILLAAATSFLFMVSNLFDKDGLSSTY